MSYSIERNVIFKKFSSKVSFPPALSKMILVFKKIQVYILLDLLCLNCLKAVGLIYFIMTKTDLRKGLDLLAKQ